MIKVPRKASTEEIHTPKTASAKPASTVAGMLEQPGYLIRRLNQLSNAAFMSESEGYDVTPVQYSALVVINGFPNSDAAALSDIIASDRATVGQALLRLEQKELIAREQCAEDKRRKILKLTTKGETVLNEVSQLALPMEQKIVGKLTKRERETLVKIMQKLIAPTINL